MTHQNGERSLQAVHPTRVLVTLSQYVRCGAGFLSPPLWGVGTAARRYEDTQQERRTPGGPCLFHDHLWPEDEGKKRSISPIVAAPVCRGMIRVTGGVSEL